MNFSTPFSVFILVVWFGFAGRATAQNPIPVSPPSLTPRVANLAPAATPTGPAAEATGAASANSSPAQVAAAGGDYVLAPSDTIEMNVFHQPDLTTRSPIASDGSVQFPLIGEVKIAGLALRNAREVIRKRYNTDYLVEPQVYLNVVGYAQRTFTILGQVAKPGTYDFPGGKSLTLLEAVGIAGGFTRLANHNSIDIKRDSSRSERTIKVKRVDSNKTFELQPNDVVTIGESWF